MRFTTLAVALALCVPVTAAFAADTPTSQPAPTTSKIVTLDVTKAPVLQVLKDIAKQTGQTILVEKTVSGNLTMKIKDVSLEEAMASVTKTLKVQWRAIYVPEGSIMATDAETLAAQMRSVMAVRYPDIVITNAGTGGAFLHVQGDVPATEISKNLPPKIGFTLVYLVSNDEAAYKKEIKNESKKKVADYVASNKKLLEEFQKMSPEERRAALQQSMGLMSQMDPKVMASIMGSMADMDPQFMANQNKIGMQMIFSMDPEQRKRMIKMSMQANMEMMKNMTPEMMKEFQKIGEEVAAEMLTTQPKANPED